MGIEIEVAGKGVAKAIFDDRNSKHCKNIWNSSIGGRGTGMADEVYHPSGN